MVPVRFRLFFFSLGAAVYSTPDAPSPSIPLVHGQGLCAAGFNDKNSYLLQVVYRATALLRSWSPLQRLEDRDLLYGGVYTIGEHGEGVYFPTWVAT
jgi:hypothetical protein